MQEGLISWGSCGEQVDTHMRVHTRQVGWVMSRRLSSFGVIYVRWCPAVSSRLKCQREKDNRWNSFRVAKCAQDTHVCWLFPPTGQEKNPGEHRNEKATDRGGETETPVYKGAFYCDERKCACNHLNTLQHGNVSPAVTKRRPQWLPEFQFIQLWDFISSLRANNNPEISLSFLCKVRHYLRPYLGS